MKRFQVIRTHVSPYQSKDFLAQEKAIIESLGNLNYRALADFEATDTILITNTHTQLRELPPGLLRHTRLIIHPNSGYDHFSSEHDLWEKIPLVVGHTIRAQAVAEYSIGALFEGLVELPQHISWHKERSWNRKLLKGQSAWVFGYGHIGKVIADTLSVLGMNVTVVDPYINECPHILLKHWKDGDLGQADVVIAATSLNKTTFKMFNEDFFKTLKDTILFINGARGKLVDESALKEFLLTHPEAFAFLDVFEREPFSEDWHGFPQVWKTSHIAGVERDLDQKILKFEKNVLTDYIYMPEKDFFTKYQKEVLQNKWIQGVLI